MNSRPQKRNMIAILIAAVLASACQTSGNEGNASVTTAVAPVKADSVEAFAGSYEGYWTSVGKTGRAKWNVRPGSSVHAVIDAKIETPDGRINYQLAPDFDSSSGTLTVNSPSISGTITKMSDGSLLFKYKRKGRTGRYVMRPVAS